VPPERRELIGLYGILPHRHVIQGTVDQSRLGEARRGVEGDQADRGTPVA
jgi:hypothetical protein